MQHDLAIFAAKRKYPKFVPQEDTGRRIATNWKRKNCRKDVTFTQAYNKKRGPDHGSEQWSRGQDFQRRNQNYNNDGPARNFPTSYQNFSPRPNSAYGNNNSNNGRPYDQRPNQSFSRSDGNRSRNQSFNNQNGNGRNNGNFSRSPSTPKRDFSQNNYRQPRSDQPNNSAFRRSDNRPATGFTPYEHKFPQSSNQTSSNVVRFTPTDDTIIELSDLCPLNYYGVRARTPTNLEIQNSASISSTSPPETLKKIVVWRLSSCWIQEPLAQSSFTELFVKSVSYSTRLLFKKVPKSQRHTRHN